MEYTPPPLFNRGPTPLVRLLICSLLSIGLLVADARYQYLDGVRQVSSDIAHDLRTPLSRLRQRLEDAREHAATTADYAAATGLPRKTVYARALELARDHPARNVDGM